VCTKSCKLYCMKILPDEFNFMVLPVPVKLWMHFVLNLILTGARMDVSSDFILLLLCCHLSDPGRCSKYVMLMWM
jgi:hypothetical protein